MTIARPSPAPWQCAVFVLVTLVTLAGSMRPASSDQGNGAAATVTSSTGQPADGSSLPNVYPDWAAAIVPAYTSNVTGKGRTTDEFYDTYGIVTTDPYDTVLAWYKAHVKTTWPDRNPAMTAGKVGNVTITLQGDSTSATIGFIKKR
jgi:hypothetical protein